MKKFRDHGRATSTSKVDSSEGYPLLPTSEGCETFWGRTYVGARIEYTSRSKKSEFCNFFCKSWKIRIFAATEFVLKLQLAVYFAGRCVRDVVVVGGAPSVVSAHKWSARSALAAKLRLHRRNAQRRPGVTAERSAVRPGWPTKLLTGSQRGDKKLWEMYKLWRCNTWEPSSDKCEELGNGRDYFWGLF